MSEARSKRCTGCGEEKALEEFHRRNTQGVKDGRTSRCKACAKAKAAAYYEKNRERIIERTGAYNAANRAAVTARTRAWRRRNPEKTRVYNQRTINADPEAWRERRRKWERENPDKLRVRNARRRARLRGAFVENVSLNDLLENGNLCGICGDPIEGPPHIDHIVPLAAGGMHEIANCQLAHPSCNHRKSDRTDYVAA